MKRLLQCDEWAKLGIGEGGLESIEDLTSILIAWRQKTGTDPSQFFDLRPDSITPKFWSGSLETPRLRLEVSPIGSGMLVKTQRAALDRTLSSMLAYASSSQSLNAGNALLSPDGNRYEALVLAFCEELQLARRRLVLRRYVTARDCLMSPRGRIAFPSQCYEAIRRPGRFASEWVALTEDVPENRIFKAVLSLYRPRCSSSTRAKIDACIAELDGVQAPGEIRLEWSRVRTDRLPESYSSLLKLSKMLLDDEAVGVFAGETLATAEILFTSRLFERYVSKEISWMAIESGLISNPQGRGTFLCCDEDDADLFELIPDVRLTDGGGRTAVILDAKWKAVNHNSKSRGVKREDIYQMLAYGAKYGCQNLVLIYPDTSAATGAVGFVDRFTASLTGTEYTFRILRLPMLASDLGATSAFLRRFLVDASPAT